MWYFSLSQPWGSAVKTVCCYDSQATGGLKGNAYQYKIGLIFIRDLTPRTDIPCLLGQYHVQTMLSEAQDFYVIGQPDRLLSVIKSLISTAFTALSPADIKRNNRFKFLKTICSASKGSVYILLVIWQAHWVDCAVTVLSEIIKRNIGGIKSEVPGNFHIFCIAVSKW